MRKVNLIIGEMIFINKIDSIVRILDIAGHKNIGDRR